MGVTYVQCIGEVQDFQKLQKGSRIEEFGNHWSHTKTQITYFENDLFKTKYNSIKQ